MGFLQAMVTAAPLAASTNAPTIFSFATSTANTILGPCSVVETRSTRTSSTRVFRYTRFFMPVPPSGCLETRSKCLATSDSRLTKAGNRTRNASLRAEWRASLATIRRALLRWKASFGLCSLTRVR
jgi:hypothetical protein